MKTIEPILIGLAITAAVLSEMGCGRSGPGPQREAEKATMTRVDVAAMKLVPDGHFLVNLQSAGSERLLNFQVQDNGARCVNSSDPRLKGLQGKFQPIGNGVFLIVFQNPNHTASQFWVFRNDGSAAIKEVPDRGEQQNAIPVTDDSLELPKRTP
ncbi:MAG: hypothetical protein DME26_11525 [Verrucomicrobia bacterium]|nr:MAG: hypothetical protein DME26_11525 [Verrucomicrobiota bacterium]